MIATPPPGSHRKLQVTANPSVTLKAAHVPRWCRGARAVLLGPLTQHDVDAASFLKPQGLLDRLLAPPPPQLVGLMAQGYQRALGPDGEVSPLDAPSRRLLVRWSVQAACVIGNLSPFSASF